MMSNDTTTPSPEEGEAGMPAVAATEAEASDASNPNAKPEATVDPVAQAVMTNGSPPHPKPAKPAVKARHKPVTVVEAAPPVADTTPIVEPLVAFPSSAPEEPEPVPFPMPAPVPALREMVGETLPAGTLREMEAGRAALAAHAERATPVQVPPAPHPEVPGRDPNWVPGFSNSANLA